MKRQNNLGSLWLYWKNILWTTCIRDIDVRDQDIWFQVRDETHIFYETETFKIASRDWDALTETAALLKLCMAWFNLYEV